MHACMHAYIHVYIYNYIYIHTYPDICLKRVKPMGFTTWFLDHPNISLAAALPRRSETH